MTRDGRWAMDAATFQGLTQALRSSDFEMRRVQTAQSILANHYVTAIQFGLILDAFQSDFAKLNVAQMAASHVVNPQHTLGYGSKFNNSLVGGQYTELMAQQVARP